MREAAGLVRDGDHLALSGFACARNAVAFTHSSSANGAPGHRASISALVKPSQSPT